MVGREKIDEEILNQMIESVDLLEYISEEYDVHKINNDSWAISCPLHRDKTPSLKITPSLNKFHCFSCGFSGTILQWMIRVEGLSFAQAIDKLSAMTGIDAKKYKQSSSFKLFKELKNVWKVEDNKTNQRKLLPPSEIDKYKREYPQEWLDEGIRKEAMDEFNIRIDDNANRIVYPIWDNNGNIITIKGRTRYKNFKEMKIAKYISYNKIYGSDFLVGLRENINHIKDKNEVIVVEGIKSVMKLWGWGYDNAVAAETSSMTDMQIKLLLSLNVKSVVIAFDSDVSPAHVRETANKLKRFMNVYIVYDKRGLLGGASAKASPPDLGLEVWEKLYSERTKII